MLASSAVTEEPHSAEAVRAMRERGVVLPAPEQVVIGREVPLEAIAPGAVLHPFCRLHGAQTRVDAGAVIGEAGPVTLEDAWVGAEARVGTLGPVTLRGAACGPRSVLGCGVAEEAVFLGRELEDPDFTTGYGFRVRKGSLYEEDANSAQHTDTKMTVLLPWVTLGSNINWCDVLVTGGSGAEHGDFSEIGSGAVHFNFTPRGDKATGSLLGNVVDGVFLDEARIFIGGNTSLIGPLRAAFGAYAAAGGRFTRDLAPGLNPGSAAPDETQRGTFDARVYNSVKRVVAVQLACIAELAALEAWYVHVRAHLARNDPDRQALYARGRAVVQRNRAERIRQLGGLAENVERSARELRRQGGDDPRVMQHETLVQRWPDMAAHLEGFDAAAHPPPTALLEALEAAEHGSRGHYTRAVRALGPDGRLMGRAWLRTITRAAAPAELREAVPDLRSLG